MYKAALSLVERKGTAAAGSTLKEYRVGNLAIHYLPKTGHLEVWYLRKVLIINPSRKGFQVSHYLPGEWQEELKGVAAAR
jgi:hypothetical protein